MVHRQDHCEEEATKANSLGGKGGEFGCCRFAGRPLLRPNGRISRGIWDRRVSTIHPGALDECLGQDGVAIPDMASRERMHAVCGQWYWMQSSNSRGRGRGTFDS